MHRRLHLERLGARHIAGGGDLQRVAPERYVGDPKAAGLVGVGALGGQSIACLLHEKHQLGLRDWLTIGPLDLTLDLGARRARGTTSSCIVRPRTGAESTRECSTGSKPSACARRT